MMQRLCKIREFQKKSREKNLNIACESNNSSSHGHDRFENLAAAFDGD